MGIFTQEILEMAQSSWKTIAGDVCCSILSLDPLDPINETDANMFIAALLGVVGLPGCPESYKKQAGLLKLDGEWGPTAQITHLLLGKLADKEADKMTQEFYKTYG